MEQMHVGLIAVINTPLVSLSVVLSVFLSPWWSVVVLLSGWAAGLELASETSLDSLCFECFYLIEQ